MPGGSAVFMEVLRVGMVLSRAIDSLEGSAFWAREIRGIDTTKNSKANRM